MLMKKPSLHIQARNAKLRLQMANPNCLYITFAPYYSLFRNYSTISYDAAEKHISKDDALLASSSCVVFFYETACERKTHDICTSILNKAIWRKVPYDSIETWELIFKEHPDRKINVPDSWPVLEVKSLLQLAFGDLLK